MSLLVGLKGTAIKAEYLIHLNLCKYQNSAEQITQTCAGDYD